LLGLRAVAAPAAARQRLRDHYRTGPANTGPANTRPGLNGPAR
jgi:hypothetical protein